MMAQTEEQKDKTLVFMYGNEKGMYRTGVWYAKSKDMFVLGFGNVEDGMVQELLSLGRGYFEVSPVGFEALIVGILRMDPDLPFDREHLARQLPKELSIRVFPKRPNPYLPPEVARRVFSERMSPDAVSPKVVFPETEFPEITENTDRSFVFTFEVSATATGKDMWEALENVMTENPSLTMRNLTATREIKS